MTNTACDTSPAHLVTIATWGGAPLFRDTHIARIASRIIHQPKTWRHAECLAWVLMPEYWHGIVRLTTEDNGADITLAKVIAQMKKKVAKGVRDEGRISPVWQRVYVSEALDENTDLRSAARDLVMTPVNAKLVPRVGDYSYWNAVWTKDTV